MHRPLPCCPWVRALGTGRRAENHVPLDAPTGGTHLAVNGPARGLHGHHAGIEPVCLQPPGAWVDHLQVPRDKAAPFPCRRQLSLIDRMAATWRISPKLSLPTRVKPAPRASQVASREAGFEAWGRLDAGHLKKSTINVSRARATSALASNTRFSKALPATARNSLANSRC
jgi:hypothetical protein